MLYENKIVGIQPMSEPVGLVYALKFVYGNKIKPKSLLFGLFKNIPMIIATIDNKEYYVPKFVKITNIKKPFLFFNNSYNYTNGYVSCKFKFKGRKLIVDTFIPTVNSLDSVLAMIKKHQELIPITEMEYYKMNVTKEVKNEKN